MGNLNYQLMLVCDSLMPVTKENKHKKNRTTHDLEQQNAIFFGQFSPFPAASFVS